MSTPHPLIDAFGRLATDLRVSITDRCNFRCTYCMPEEGLTWLPRDQILDYEEIARLVGVFARLGIRSVKLTGGEPTVRAGLLDLVRMLRDIAPRLELSMTTNGMLLAGLAERLVEAGLDRVTVSLDSLLRHRFLEMTRRDALSEVLKGIDAAAAAGLAPVKVNCLVIAGTNDDELQDFVLWTRRTGHEVRFIEYMPLDAQRAWERCLVLPSSDLRARIGAVFPLIPVTGDGGPAKRYVFADGAPGSVGLVSSVSEPFCDTCNRLRLTADGGLRTCLFGLDPVDLGRRLRAGSTDEELAAVIREAVSRKWAGHRVNDPDFLRPDKSMSMIGG